jgi:WD repeat-containing protein 22
VIVHEVETRQPLDYFLHEEPVYGLSVHPANADIFVTACSDGRLLLYDMR